MKNNNTDHSEPSVRFVEVALGFVLSVWSAYALAAAGFFSYGAVLALAVVATVGIGVMLFRWLAAETLPARIVFVSAIAFSVLTLAGTVPSIFSGRDQGAIAEAAIGLAEYGRFAIPSPADGVFFDLYGPGKALNFPGFSYDETGALRSQFPHGYIAWLGAFFSLFGLPGLVAGNGILLVLSILTLFVLVRTLAGTVAGAGAVAIAMASFSPSWFAKFTLTENLGLFLFLLLSLSLILFLKRPAQFPFLAAIVSAVLFAVTRIEGLAILAVLAVILASAKPARAFVTGLPSSLRISAIVLPVLLLALDLLGNLPHYVAIAKAVLPKEDIGTGAVDTLVSVIPFWKLFLPYGLLPVFVLGTVGVAVLLIRKDRLALVPLLLALPTFLYIIAPNVSADHPWMLRRILSSVWPAMLVSGVVGTAAAVRSMKTLRGGLLPAIVSVTAILTLAPTIPAFGFSENGTLPDDIGTLADTIGEHDLLLVDRMASGDPYAMIDGPLRFLFGKQAVYFFNPDDLTRIPTDRFDRILLLTPPESETWDALPASLTPRSRFTFTTRRLGPLPLDTARFPDIRSVTTESVLFELTPL